MTLKRTEHQEQCAVIQWANYYEAKWPELRLLFAIPNGGARHIVTARKLKTEGVKAGVPDLFLPVPKFHSGRGVNNIVPSYGLFIEMKVKPNKPSKEQIMWIDLLNKQGYRVEVCYSADEAIEVLRGYLE